MRFFALFVLVFCSTLALADLPESVRLAIRQIETDYTTLSADDKENALMRAFESMKVANYVLGGGAMNHTVGSRPYENGDTLLKFDGMDDLSPKQKTEAYKLMQEVSRRIQKAAWPEGNETHAMKGQFAELDKIVDQKAAEEPRATAARSAAPKPEEDERRLTRAQEEQARKELDTLLAAHRDLMEVAREHLTHGERGEGEDYPQPESVADRNKRLLGVMATVNAINSGQPLTSKQIDIAHNLNAHLRGPVPAAGGSGSAGSGGEQAMESFDQRLDNAIGRGDARKAVALLKAEIARITKALEAKGEALNQTDRNIIARAKRTAKAAKMDRPSSWSLPQIKLPDMSAIVDPVLNAIDALGKKIPRIDLTKIPFPKISLPKWPEASSQESRPEPRHYEPPPRRYYEEPTYRHSRHANGGGEGCFYALQAMVGVAGLGAVGVVGTVIVASNYSDEAYIDDSSSPEAKKIENILQIVEGNGTWGTPDPRAQRKGVYELATMTGAQKPYVLERVNQALKDGKWKIDYMGEAQKNYAALIDNMIRGLPKSDREDIGKSAIGKELLNILNETRVPLELRRQALEKLRPGGGYSFSSYHREREAWTERVAKVREAIKKYEDALRRPDQISNPDDVRKWLKQAQEEYLPEAERELRLIHDPFDDLPKETQNALLAFVTEVSSKEPQTGYDLAHTYLGPATTQTWLFWKLEKNEGFKDKAFANPKLKDAMKNFLKSYDETRTRQIFGY